MNVQDMIPFLIVGIFLGAVVYSTVKNRRNFVDEQTSIDNLYEHDSIPTIDDLINQIKDLEVSENLTEASDITTYLNLLGKTEEVDTDEAHQLNQRIASTIRTLKRAVDSQDAEQILYTSQYLEILLEQRAHISNKNSK